MDESDTLASGLAKIPAQKDHAGDNNLRILSDFLKKLCDKHVQLRGLHLMQACTSHNHEDKQQQCMFTEVKVTCGVACL